MALKPNRLAVDMCMCIYNSSENDTSGLIADIVCFMLIVCFFILFAIRKVCFSRQLPRFGEMRDFSPLRQLIFNLFVFVCRGILIL